MKTILVIIIGCVIISIFDAIGAIVSRLLKFNYAWLTFGSIIILGFIAIYIKNYDGLIIGVLSSSFVGAFDAFFGMKIAKYFKANIKNTDIDLTPNSSLLFFMSIFGGLIGFMAILIFT